MNKYFPFLTWIKTYNKASFLQDLPAGITVGIILIPQGMAYAMIAGLPPVYGLYAALFPQVVYAFLGTSRQLSVGPVAMDSLLVASALSVMAVTESQDYIFLAVVLAFLMGLIQLLLGLFRLGFLVNFLSKPVISGFTSAAAVIIAANQLKYITGIRIERSSQAYELIYNTFAQINEIHLLTFAMGIGGIVVIKSMQKWVKKVPGSLLVVVLGIVLAKFLHLDQYGLTIVSDIPEGLPSFGIPNIRLDQLKELLPVAFTLALIAFMEAISVAKAIEQNHTDYKISANQELIALGTSNIVGSFFQAYPTTGGFSRSAVNEKSGAQTGVASIISALVVGLTLLFFTPLFYYLPTAVLGSIIIVAVIGLIDFKYPIRLWKNRKDEFILLIFTFSITLFFGIKEGILSGVALSLLLLIYRTTKPHLAVLGNLPGTTFYKNVKRFPQIEERKDVLIVRFDSQLYFANANFFRESVFELINRKGSALKLVVLSVEGVNFIDSSAANMLRNLIKEVKDLGIVISVTNAIGPVRDILKKSEILDVLGEECFFINVPLALQNFDGEDVNQHQDIVLQNNLK